MRDGFGDVGHVARIAWPVWGMPLLVLTTTSRLSRPSKCNRAGGVDLGQRADERQVIDADLLVGDDAVEVPLVEDAALGRAERAVELVEQRDVNQRGLDQVERPARRDSWPAGAGPGR